MLSVNKKNIKNQYSEENIIYIFSCQLGSTKKFLKKNSGHSKLYKNDEEVVSDVSTWKKKIFQIFRVVHFVRPLLILIGDKKTVLCIKYISDDQMNQSTSVFTGTEHRFHKKGFVLRSSYSNLMYIA